MNKRLTIKIIIVFVLIGLIATLVLPFYLIDPIKVKTYADKRSAFIGERIAYRIEVLCRKKVTIESIETSEFPEDITVVSEKRDISDSIFFKNEVLVFSMILFSTGEFIIEPPVVTYTVSDRDVEGTQTISSRPVKIKIKSILPDDFNDNIQKIRVVGSELASSGIPGEGLTIKESGEISEIEGLIRLRIHDAMSPQNIFLTETYHKFMYLLAVILFIILLYFILTRRKKERRKRPLSDIESIHRRLEKLENTNAGTISDYKEFSAEFYSILLSFLRYKFGISSSEMTSKEIISCISETALKDEDREYIINVIEVSESIQYSPVLPEQLPEVIDIKRLKSFIYEGKRSDLE